MPPRSVLYTVATIVIGVVLAYGAVRGHLPRTTSEWLSPIGPAVTFAGVILWLFDRWVWRWPGARRLHSRPVLHGTWHGTLASEYIDPETNQQVPADPNVFLVVRQRFWHVAVRLLTKESASLSMVATFRADVDDVQELISVYTNKPKGEVRDRSVIHLGALILGAPRDTRPGFAGEYFTDRMTRGSLTFRRHLGGPVETHAEAMRSCEALE